VSTAFREEFSQSVLRTFDALDPVDLDRLFEELGTRAQAWLVSQHLGEDSTEIRFEADVRYYRQGHALTQPVVVPVRGLDELARSFDDDHLRRYGFNLPNALREVVVVRAIAIGHTPAVPAEPVAISASPDPSEALEDTTHQAYFDGRLLATPVFRRARLLAGHRVPGPAIIVEMDSTTLIEPGWRGEVDQHGNILIRSHELRP